MIKGNHKPGPLQKAQTSRTPAQNVDSISYGVGMRCAHRMLLEPCFTPPGRLAAERGRAILLADMHVLSARTSTQLVCYFAFAMEADVRRRSGAVLIERDL